MLCFCFMFPGACQLFFLLARFGRKPDRHIKNIRMFFKFFMFFLPMGLALFCLNVLVTRCSVPEAG